MIADMNDKEMKILKGWRTKYNWDKPSGIPELDRYMEACTSDDGWMCPYCEHKHDLCGEEFGNEEYMKLLHDSYDTALTMTCTSCDKEFFLRCHMTIKYSTCADKEFGEKDESK